MFILSFAHGHWAVAVGYALAILLAVGCGAFLSLAIGCGVGVWYRGNVGVYFVGVLCSCFMVDYMVKFSKCVRTGKTKIFSNYY